MKFDPQVNKTHENIGFILGLVLSFLLSSIILTFIISWINNLSYIGTYPYVIIGLIIIAFLGLAIERLLR